MRVPVFRDFGKMYLVSVFLLDFIGLAVSHVTNERSRGIRRGDEVVVQGATLSMSSLL